MTIETIADPKSVSTMAEVRANIDALDRALVGLLRQRLDFIEAAARIKQDRNTVRDEARKADVINKAKREAERIGLPTDLVEQLYEQLIEYSIAHEFVRFDEIREVESR